MSEIEDAEKIIFGSKPNLTDVIEMLVAKEDGSWYTEYINVSSDKRNIIMSGNMGAMMRLAIDSMPHLKSDDVALIALKRIILNKPVESEHSVTQFKGENPFGGGMCVFDAKMILDHLSEND